jgi:hypothetical protein
VLVTHGTIKKSEVYEVKKSVYCVLASAVAAILWLVAGWLLPDVLGVGSLLALLAAANAPLLAPRLRTVELPSGVKLHFSAHEEESAARGGRGLKDGTDDASRLLTEPRKRQK